MRKNSRNRRSVKRRSYSRNRKLYRSQKMRGGGAKKKRNGSQKKNPKRKGSKKKRKRKETVGTGDVGIEGQTTCEVKPEYKDKDIFHSLLFRVANGKFVFAGGDTSLEYREKVTAPLPEAGATITHLNGKNVSVVDPKKKTSARPADTIYVTKFNYSRFLGQIIGETEAQKIYKITYKPPKRAGRIDNPFGNDSTTLVSEGPQSSNENSQPPPLPDEPTPSN